MDEHLTHGFNYGRMNKPFEGVDRSISVQL